MPTTIRQAAVFCDGLDHPECVAVHPDGSVWAGSEAGDIYRISPDGRRKEIVLNTGGFILGIAFAPGGKWLAACDLKHKCIWRIDPVTGAHETFAKGAGKHRFNIPNHLAFDPQGRLYVSESGAFRKINGKILRFAPDGSGVVWHEGPFNFANGLALSPRGDALYVACTWLPGVERIMVLPNGSPGRRSVYVRLRKVLPDGLAFDARGGLYISCYTPARIYRVSPTGRVSVLIDDWEAHALANPTNIAFAGQALTDLLVANLGRWHLTRIPLKVRGLPLASHIGV